MTPYVSPVDKVFGLEPAVVFNSISALVAVLLSFGLIDWDLETQGVVLAVVTAVLNLAIGWKVVQNRVSVVSAVVQAVGILLITFGFSLDTAQLGTVVALLNLVLGAVLVRPQVTTYLTKRDVDLVG